VRYAREQLSWVLEHLDPIESDLSAFHRIDDIDDVPMSRFIRLVSHLPAYQGALRLTLQQTGTATSRIVTEQPSVRQVAEDPDNTPEAEVAARWARVLVEQYPDAAAGGIERVSDTEMIRMLASG
jgi:hypothetical protein